MGKKATATATFNNQKSIGIAMLETDELLFRGDFYKKILFRDMSSVTTDGNTLTVVWPEGTLSLELVSGAAKWAEAILNPKKLIDKLGVKRDMRIAIIGVQDEAFSREIESCGCKVDGDLAAKVSMIFFLAPMKRDLIRLPHLKTRIPSDGAIWVVFPKGKTEIKDHDVITAGRNAGLTDVKVVRFSDVLTALKFVVPVGERK